MEPDSGRDNSGIGLSPRDDYRLYKELVMTGGALTGAMAGFLDLANAIRSILRQPEIEAKVPDGFLDWLVTPAGKVSMGNHLMALALDCQHFKEAQKELFRRPVEYHRKGCNTLYLSVLRREVSISEIRWLLGGGLAPVISLERWNKFYEGTVCRGGHLWFNRDCHSELVNFTDDGGSSSQWFSGRKQEEEAIVPAGTTVVTGKWLFPE